MRKMKKILSALLLCASISGLTGCGENEIKTATEIKDIISTYEANIENVDFSKFTLNHYYNNHSEYNINDYTEDKKEDWVVSYDESGYLYYKNHTYNKDSEDSNGYYTSKIEQWLYIDADYNLIWATEKTDSKKYDVLEHSSYEEAKQSFLEYVPKCLDDFDGWFYYQSNNVYDIPKKYCSDYIKTASNLSERVINELDPPMTVNVNDGIILDITFSSSARYVFENGLLKSYEAKYSGTSTRTDSYGVEWVENYVSEYNINLSLTSDLKKPDLSTFNKSYY